MQEKPDRVAMAALAQHLGQRNEMIVVHPHDVVRVKQAAQPIGEVHIDAAIAAEIAA